MRHVRTPVFVRVGARKAPGRIEDVTIGNIVAGGCVCDVVDYGDSWASGEGGLGFRLAYRGDWRGRGSSRPAVASEDVADLVVEGVI